MKYLSITTQRSSVLTQEVCRSDINPWFTRISDFEQVDPARYTA